MSAPARSTAPAQGGPWIKIILMVVAVGAIATMAWSFIGGGTTRSDLKPQAKLICISPQCGQETGLTIGELRKLKQSKPANDREPPAVQCPKCQQMTAYRAELCPKCGKAFLSFKARPMASGGFECPFCHADTWARQR